MAAGTVTNDITELVYGADDTEGIVSIDVWGNTIYEYHLTNKGETVCNIVKNYQPWYIVHSDAEAANMAGTNHFNSLRRLNKFKDMQQLYDAREASGRRDEFLMIGNKASQYMVETGKTLFKGIDVDDLHILGFDIETTGLSPLDSEVKMISVVSNRGYNDVLYNQDEAVLIQQFVQLMETLDPDIVLTYNGHRFDIPFLMKRAEFKGLDLGIGRNGIAPIQYKFQHRMDGENKMIDGMRIFGRHHIDMMYAVMKFDALERKLSNYKLKSVVAQYGLEKAGRVHLNFNEILEGITSEDLAKRNQTIEYCRADAEDLLKLHNHVCPAEFYQARIIPMNYYALINAGSVGRINTMMIRAYLRNMHSIPMYSTEFEPFGGGLNECNPGIYEHVGDSDLTSMYPSIQIHRGFFPKSDSIGIMREVLIYLRDERIKMKKDFKKSTDAVKKASLDGKQKAMKVLLNCFHPETKILTQTGYKAIDKLDIGELVLSIDPITLKHAWKPLVAKEMKRRGALMLEIKTSHNHILKVTDEHNLAAFANDSQHTLHIGNKVFESTHLVKKFAKDFKVGDKLPLQIGEFDINTHLTDMDMFSVLDYMDNDVCVEFVLNKGYHGRTFVNYIKEKFGAKLSEELEIFVLQHAYRISTSKLSNDIRHQISKMSHDIDYNGLKMPFRIQLRAYKSKPSRVTYKLKDFLQFMGWFVSEGSTYKSHSKFYTNGRHRGITYKIQITQYRSVNPDNCDAIEALLKHMGFDCFVTTHQLSFCCKPLWILLHEIWQIKTARFKHFPQELLTLPNKHIKVLLDTYFKGDGCVIQAKSTHRPKRKFSTSSPQLKDDICYILQRLGIPYSIYTKDKDKCYRIHEIIKTYSHNNIMYDYITEIKQISMPEYVWDINVADYHTVCAGTQGSICTFQSHFGTMASMGFYWRDNAAAAKITEEGRRLISTLRDTLRSMDFTVISLDTDGISYSNGKAFDLAAVTAALKAVLPQGMYRADEEGIESKPIRKLIAFHPKTYAILRDDGSIQSKGGALTSADIPPFVRQFTSNLVRLMFDRKFDDIRLYYQSIISDITNSRLPITDFVTVKRVNKTVQQYQDTMQSFADKGKTKARLPLWELAIETKRQLEVGDKVSVYHADVVVDKPLTKTQAKRAAQFDTMDTLFAVQSTPRTMTVQRLKWADQYDPTKPDISTDYYIGRLNDKVYGLFHDPKTNVTTILTDAEFDSIFGLDAGKVSIYRFQYTDFATYLPEVDTFSKWERLRKDQLRDLMRQGGTDMYTTIQQFDNQYVTAGESVYHPLYFDVDASDLGAAFDTATCIYRYFANVLKVPLQYITVWFSGSKGFHIEVDGRVFGYRPSPYLTQVNKDIANWLIKQYQLTSLDVGSIYSSRRMWRIPFSINSKSGLRKTWLPQFDQFKSITEVSQYVALNQDLIPAYEAYIDHINDIGAPAKVLQEHATWYATHHDAFVARTKLAVVQKPSWKFERLAAALPRCIDYLLRESISVAGDRNRATMTLLSFFKESGITMEEAIERVSEWTMRIPKGLTSATNHATIKQNVTSVARSIYNGGTYVFSCGFAKSLIARSGFECPTVCVLKDD